MAVNKEPSRLRRGKAFHKEMQGDWVNSAEGEIVVEKGITKPGGGKGWHTVVIEIPMRRDPTCNVGLNKNHGHPSFVNTTEDKQDRFSNFNFLLWMGLIRGMCKRPRPRVPPRFRDTRG